MAEPLRDRPALPATPSAGASPGGPFLHERAGLCLTQVIARPGQHGEIARGLGLELPRAANRTTTDGAIVVLCLRPGDWLIVSLDAEGRRGGVAAEARRRLAGRAAVIDQSHGRVVLRLAGEGARQILQQGCNLDLDRGVFAPGAMAQTAISGIAVLLHAVHEDGFDLHVARSFAASLVRWLEHHGAGAAAPDPGRLSEDA